MAFIIWAEIPAGMVHAYSLLAANLLSLFPEVTHVTHLLPQPIPFAHMAPLHSSHPHGPFHMLPRAVIHSSPYYSLEKNKTDLIWLGVSNLPSNIHKALQSILKLNVNLTTQTMCFPSSSDTYSPGLQIFLSFRVLSLLTLA